ncbi:MAG: peptidoglycan DD-metalloendopeptidase family protein [Thermoflexales bacterium]|nr:peptidoglycan DD-metalloendopeptidase family protein [Thermoflexales bacterium]
MKRAIKALILGLATVIILLFAFRLVSAIGPINVLPYIGSYPVTCGWHASCGATPIAGKGVDFGIGGQNGLTVYSSADGIVHRAAYNTDDGGWGREVVIRTSDGIGGCYYHRYAHLYGTYGVFVREGQMVGKGTPIGYADNTGSSTGPHLHYHVYHTSSCSISYTSLNESVSVYIATDSEPVYGYNSNGSLRSSYYYSDFPSAFQSSGSKSYENYSFPFSTKVTDDGDDRFSTTGSWTTQQAGFDRTHMNNRDMRWVYNVQSGATASATWRGGITSGGFYQIYVFIPSNYATTSNAHYRIFYYDPSSAQIKTYDVYVNQNNYYNQWVSLGNYCGNAGDYPRVILYNDTGEPNGTKRVGADAVMWIRLGNNCPTLATIPSQDAENQSILLSSKTLDRPLLFQLWQSSPLNLEEGAWRQYSGHFDFKDQSIRYSLLYPAGWFLYSDSTGGSIQIQNFSRAEMQKQGIADMGALEIKKVKIQMDHVPPCKGNSCSQLEGGETIVLSGLVGSAWIEYDELFNLSVQKMMLPIGSDSGALQIVIYVDGEPEVNADQKMMVESILGSLRAGR